MSGLKPPTYETDHEMLQLVGRSFSSDGVCFGHEVMSGLKPPTYKMPGEPIFSCYPVRQRGHGLADKIRP